MRKKALSVLTAAFALGSGLWVKMAEQRKASKAAEPVGEPAGEPVTEVSVVVPAYDEAPNVRPLCERLFKATRAAGLTAELLLVDDFSGEGSEATKKVVQELKKEGFDVDVKVRMPEEGKGLSSAVVLGLRMAKHPVLLVMDADLQHEPESVPDVVGPILRGEADFAVGSRHVAGGGAEDFPLVRRIISMVATLLAAPLTTSTDPMSGFFALSKETFQRGQNRLNPMGFKIGLELMVRCQCQKVKDVPIRFRDREAGESKLTMKQNLYYLQHLLHLYWFRYSGLIVMGILYVLCCLVLAYNHWWSPRAKAKIAANVERMAAASEGATSSDE